MADKEITPKDPQATEVVAEDDERDEARPQEPASEDQVRKAGRKTGRYMKYSDRNLKEHVVPVRW